MGTEILVVPEFDDYESALYDSELPEDRAALMIRMAIRIVGLDPDKDCWQIRRRNQRISTLQDESTLVRKPIIEEIREIE